MAELLYRLEYIKDGKVPMDEGVFVQIQEDLPEYLELTQKEEFAGGDESLAGKLFSIPGVVAIEMAADRLYIEKSPVFAWSEVLPSAIGYVVDAGEYDGISKHSGISFTLDSFSQRKERIE